MILGSIFGYIFNLDSLEKDDIQLIKKISDKLKLAVNYEALYLPMWVRDSIWNSSELENEIKSQYGEQSTIKDFLLNSDIPTDIVVETLLDKLKPYVVNKLEKTEYNSFKNDLKQFVKSIRSFSNHNVSSRKKGVLEAS